MTMLPTDDDSEYSEQELIEESRKASPANLLIKIESFSLLKENVIRKYKSSAFEAGGYKWKLEVKFNPDEDEDEDVNKRKDDKDSGKGSEYIGVFISMAETSYLPDNWEVNAITTIFLYNHISDNYLCFRDAIGTVAKPCRFHELNSVHGSPKMINKKMLMEPRNGFLVNDTCVIGAEVSVIKILPTIERLSFTNKCVFVAEVSGHNKSSTPYKREWKISKYSKLGRVWTSEEFSAGGYNWQIRMYPNGDGRSSGNYMSIFISCVDAKSFPHGKNVNATCLFILRNKNNHLPDHSKKVTNMFTSTNISWGFSDYISVDDMSKPLKGFVVEDYCSLEIQLSVLGIN